MADMVPLTDSQIEHLKELKEFDNRYSVYSLSSQKVLRCDLCFLELNYYRGVYGYDRHLQSKRHHDSKQLKVVRMLYEKYCDDALS